MTQEAGICPKCGKADLEYFPLEYVDEAVYYPYTCNNCLFEGREWYVMEFYEHTDNDGIEIDSPRVPA